MEIAIPHDIKARAIGRIALLAMLVQGAGGMSHASAGQPSDILWSYPADQIAGIPDHLAVTGAKDGKVFKPTGLSLPDTPATGARRQTLPFDTDLLPLFQATAFGVEERAKASVDGKGVTLSCTAGARPAGLLLRADGFRYPRAARAALRVEGRASAEFSFAVTPEGEDAPAAAPMAARDGQLASISAASWASTDTPKQLVVTCPGEGARLTLTAIRLVAEASTVATTTGSWLWDARPWFERPEALIFALQRDGIRDLFLQVRIENGAVAEEPKLIGLLAALSGAGIAVHAVEGDADMASAAGRPHALERARVLRRLKERTGLILSFQYDVEPYLRPGFAADPAAGWREWAATISEVADTLGERISVVVPFWMLESQGGEQAFERASDAIADVAVMAYRTDGAQIEQIAAHWLDWGVYKDILINVAVENGSIPREFVRTYERSERGDLVLDRSGTRPTVRILSFPVPDSYAKPTYSFRGEVEVDAARISFLNDRHALAVVRRRVELNLATWTSFRGLMVHGLITPGG